MNKQVVIGNSHLGYTLIEVILFMAISSGLALVAFLGLGPRLSNVRFTDASRAIQSDITNQILNAQYGVNTRPDNLTCKQIVYFDFQPAVDTSSSDDAGSSQACVINGKLAVLSDSSVKYYTIISLRKAVTNNSICTDPPDTFEGVAKCFKPRIMHDFDQPAPQTIYNKNGLKTSRIGSSSSPISIGYIQNPNGTNKYLFMHNTDPFWDPLIDENNSSVLADTQVCLSLNNRQAVLSFSPGKQEPVLSSKRCI